MRRIWLQRWAYRSQRNNKIPAEHGDFWYKFRTILNLYLSLADGEGFEPPVELPPQRFSRPSQSTALPPILNFFPTGLSNRRFCSLTAPAARVENFGYYTVSGTDCQFICYADYYTC